MRSSFKVVREIKAPTGLAFKAWTEAGGLREWLCRSARTDPRVGGRFSLGWWSGYQAHGTYTVFEPPVRLGFTWLGEGEPGETNIAITLKPTDEGTQITLNHSGFGTGRKWKGQAEGAAREWNRCLDNLRSVLELGIDPRDARLPRIGLEFETAKDKMGVVVIGVVPGGPAEQAGLKKDDVVVRLDGEPTRTEEEFVDVFAKLGAGQSVNIAYRRGGKTRTTGAQLAARALPEVPDDPAVLTESAGQVHSQVLVALFSCLNGLDERAAERSPGNDEWSVKQILQHLVVTERQYQDWVVDTILGRETDGLWARLPEQMAAIASTAPSVDALLRRLEREMMESRTMVEALTPEHRAWRVRYRRMARLLLERADHAKGHVHQVERTLAAIRN